MAELSVERRAVLVATAMVGKARDVKDRLHDWGVDADAEAVRLAVASTAVRHADAELKAALAGLRRVWVVAEARGGGSAAWKLRVLVRPWTDQGVDLSRAYPELAGWSTGTGDWELWEVNPASGPITPAEVEEFVAGTVAEFQQHGLGDGRPVEVQVVR
ncbi:MAG: hypothetical protein LW650_15485 [Planctomycetaceae bacterium]|jgi:hypothetical protein|nr:hypothetical protein [Phycisphaerales bacterium]MCE2654781.1 hypothetical protein [Planctomycetaceae bacterium]